MSGETFAIERAEVLEVALPLKEPFVTSFGATASRHVVLVRLVDEGYADRMMLAGDFGRASYWTSNGGGPGLTYILWRFVPWLHSEGVPVEATQAMLVDNPARFLAF